MQVHDTVGNIIIFSGKTSKAITQWEGVFFLVLSNLAHLNTTWNKAFDEFAPG